MPTIILHGAQGAGKSNVAAAVARRFGCTSLIDGWDGKQSIVNGALVVTNLPLNDLRVPLGASTLDFHQALRML